MPKIKTKRGAAKRVKATATGKLVRCNAFDGCHHIREKKSSKRKRTFRKSAAVSSTDTKRVMRMVPYLAS
ncbi:MAG: 50S ribosomal protein L35 [Armatimonadetes bacterium]|nr:50S ribosomal protein L35 [Armatimonadota bacterium]